MKGVDKKFKELGYVNVAENDYCVVYQAEDGTTINLDCIAGISKVKENKSVMITFEEDVLIKQVLIKKGWILGIGYFSKPKGSIRKNKLTANEKFEKVGYAVIKETLDTVEYNKKDNNISIENQKGFIKKTIYRNKYLSFDEYFMIHQKVKEVGW